MAPQLARDYYVSMAERSARTRTTKKFVKELTATRPLTSEQKAEILAAAATIPTVAAS